MKFTQCFPVSRYGDVVEYEDDDLKRGNEGPCQICGDRTPFWCLFMMPFQACSTECLKELRARETAIEQKSSTTTPDVGDFLIGRDGALLCFCGDPRSDHPNDGPCNLNGLGHGIPSSEPESKCLAYRANKGDD